VANTVQIMGLGGSLRATSTSRTALEVALQATTAAGAHARLVWVRDLDLPLYTADLPVPRPERVRDNATAPAPAAASQPPAGRPSAAPGCTVAGGCDGRGPGRRASRGHT
jgi:hypothetical protein